MRTLDLVKALTEEEMKDVTQLLSENKRKSLLLLFNELEKHKQLEAEPDNAKLFKKVFSKVYSKQKDYLLRHELRLLNEVLYSYLAEQTFKNQLHRSNNTLSYWLARAYYERNVKSLFRSDIDGLIANATTHIASSEIQNLSEGTALLSMKNLWMIMNQPKVQENIEAQIKTLQDWKAEEQKRFLFKLREIEAREAYLEMYLKNLRKKPDLRKDDERTKGTLLIDLNKTENENWFAKYLTLKKHSYQTKELKRVEVLRQMLEIEQTQEGTKTLGIKAQVSTLINLGIEYILLGKYEEGDKVLAESIALSEQHKQPILAGSIHNYLVNQINLGEYEKGLKIYARFKKLLDAGRTKSNSRIYNCYCHLFLGKDEEALMYLPKATDVSLPEQIMIRFMYVIAFCIRKEYTLALSEMKNLKRTIKAIKQGNYATQLTIAELFLRYVTAHTKNKDEKEKVVSTLRKEMKLNVNTWNAMAAIDVQLRWLMKQL
jgi:hypothetical protein